MDSDLMSSPDPLSASFGNGSAIPSTRRITRSQQPQRFASLPTSSPRKQIFELDVGNKRSPQKLVVTVEAEGDGSDKENVSRRLFQSPAPRSVSRRRQKSTTTTTTTVPLRGLTDDEGTGATPRKRGRPRRSGTPTPAARKRAGTPLKRTPRRAKKTLESDAAGADEMLDVAPSSVSIATSSATPRPRGRPRKTPLKEKGAAAPRSSAVKITDSAQPPRKRGRPRRQALAPEEIEAMAEDEAVAEEVFEQSTIVVQTPTPSVQEEQEEEHMQEPEDIPQFSELQEQNDDDGDDDIWMANMSEPPTPVPRYPSPVSQEVTNMPAAEIEADEMDNASISDAPQSEADTEDDAGLFMQFDDRSDAASHVSEAASINSRAQDTMANVEDFSMIHIDSSFHANSSMRRENEDGDDQLSEMGEMTSLIVSKTLASLRHDSSINQEASINHDAGDDEDIDLVETASQELQDAVMDKEQVPAEEEQENELEEEDLERTPVPSSSRLMVPESSTARPQSAGPLFSQPASPQTWARSPRRNKRTPLSRQLALKSLQKVPALDVSPQQPSPSPMMANKDRVLADSPQRGTEDTSMYEDSFSEIPAAVLEAATPRHYRFGKSAFAEQEEEQEGKGEGEGEGEHDEHQEHTVLQEQDDDDDMQDENEDQDQPQQPEEAPSSSKSTVNAAASLSEANRLLTPDETPSPPESEANLEQAAHTSPKSLAASVMASSPPVLKSFAQSRPPILEAFRQHSRNNSTETPLSAMLSPQAVPPPMAGDIVPLDNLMVPSTATRPALSPIVRAGRALQSVTSDPPSPKDRESLLGSPFRSSTGRRTASPAESPEKTARSSPAPSTPSPVRQQPSSVQRPWSKSAFAPFAQLKNLVAQGAQAFSPRQESTSVMKDPFGPDLQKPESEASHHSRPQTADSSVSMDPHGRTGSFASSTRVAPPTVEDEMDWTAEAPAPKAQSQTNSFNSMSSTIATRGSAPDMTGAAEAEVNHSRHSREATIDAEEDEDDIWANEASRLTSQKANKSYDAIAEPPRRGKLPSPWRQNSRRLLYRDELSKASSVKGTAPADASELEFSMLSTQSITTDNRRSRQDSAPKPVAARHVDLSSFFSSPAVVPQPAMPFTGAAGAAAPRNQENQKPVSTFAKSSLASGLEKSVFEPQKPRQDLFRPVSRGLFGSSNMRMSTAAKTKVADAQPSVPQKGFLPRSQGRRDLFSPVKLRQSVEVEPQPQEPSGSHVPDRNAAISSAPSTPEPPVSVQIPQKQNFTPLRSTSGNSLFQSKPIVAPVLPPPPPSQVSNVQQLSDPFTEDADIGDISHVSDESSFLTPVLKPLPDREASPSKSCIRSPYKPKTPGRVVEFSGNALSPLAQAKARAERSALRSKLASWGQEFAPKSQPPPASLAPSVALKSSAKPAAQPVAQPTIVTMDPEANKENASISPDKPRQPLFAALKAKPPQSRQLKQVQQQQPSTDAPSPLAQGGTWTRAHWIRLDEILQQLRKNGPLNFQLQHQIVATSPQKRRSSALLGRQVLSQGVAMTIEQGHLDIVDAFKAEVGGWDEGVLAKRLFALLVGEERRRLGLVPKRRRVVSH